MSHHNITSWLLYIKVNCDIHNYFAKADEWIWVSIFIYYEIQPHCTWSDVYKAVIINVSMDVMVREELKMSRSRGLLHWMVKTSTNYWYKEIHFIWEKLRFVIEYRLCIIIFVFLPILIWSELISSVITM